MQDLNDKVTGGSLTAGQWNEVPSEIQNVIEGLGITLSSGDLNQLGKAIAGYSANGDFYTDSGAADAYVLSVIGAKQAPPAYTNGFRVRFIAGNNNTGASTISVASLGVQDIKREDASALSADDIVAGVQYELTHNGTNFVLITTLYAPQGIFLGGAAAANRLSQVSRGVFTPAIIGTTVPGVGTYTQQEGSFERTIIGGKRFLKIDIKLKWTAHTGTGFMLVAVLPETVLAVSPLSVTAALLTYTGQLVTAAWPGTNQIFILDQTSGSALSNLPLDTTGEVYIEGSFEY